MKVMKLLMILRLFNETVPTVDFMKVIKDA
jgi:hypothetical protein